MEGGARKDARLQRKRPLDLGMGSLISARGGNEWVVDTFV
jgi:hypothetical protein